jgi:Xaa-Pro aminopeptidase
MMKMGRGFPGVLDWLTSNLPQKSRIAYDPYLLSAESARYRSSAYEKKGFEFVAHEVNLVNQVWTSRPEISPNQVYIHDLEYSGRSIKEKLSAVEERLSSELSISKPRFLFTSVLDDIAWLLNLRGSDIEYNPLFFSYLLVDQTVEPSKLKLFVSPAKVEPVRDYLAEAGVEVLDYDSAGAALEALTDPVVVDESELSFGLFSKIKKPVHVPNVIARVKSVKTEREIQGFIESHKRDAVALVKYFAWLEKSLKAGESLNEWTAALHLDSLRSQQALNKGLSFENISSSGPNAAIIHYAPTAEKSRNLSLDEIYLLDSGGQYLDGTVDTTRTLHFGKPSEWEKECFTRVLLGNLDLERVRWPQGARITGNDLDVLARRWLWQAGLDYNHATGHGVGYFLNVHEGPQVLCKGASDEFLLGMNITNEPGYYEEGKFGIRIENVLFVQLSQEVQGFLEFFNVTVVPYDKALIKVELLNEQDVEFIDRYHQRVLNTVGPLLIEQGDLESYEWLVRATSPIKG